MPPRLTRLWLPSLLTGILLIAIFSVTVVRYRSTLRDEIRRTIINRDAAVLWPVTLHQLAQREVEEGDTPELLAAVLQSAQQQNMLAVAVFDPQGRTLRYAPESLLFPELPLDDYARLLKGEPISRYTPQLELDRYFAGFDEAPERHAPVLEVLLPLHGRNPKKILGYAQYYVDARPLSRELAAIDARISGQTTATLAIGIALIVLVVTVAFLLLRRAQSAIAERNERLMRANFELTLAAKASALGQITSHLVHGLQGPIAGLRAVVSSRENGETPDWETAAGYAERLQTLVGDTVGLLSDAHAHASYELTPEEIATTIRDRNQPAAAERNLDLAVTAKGVKPIDSHRGGLVCLIANNLISNAVVATRAGGAVRVTLECRDNTLQLEVSDNGPGIPPELRPHLFKPGRSGRPGGTGLGLAISHLLARQLGGELELVATDMRGTTFRLTTPLAAPA
ncbi:hypothetical protein DB347_13940 [Opitutaceae bacterium EW11]|nr:hypothetical protein DB347_13940 [Opitutaceae bacterium EW11]